MCVLRLVRCGCCLWLYGMAALLAQMAAFVVEVAAPVAGVASGVAGLFRPQAGVCFSNRSLFVWPEAYLKSRCLWHVAFFAATGTKGSIAAAVDVAVGKTFFHRHPSTGGRAAVRRGGDDAA